MSECKPLAHGERGRYCGAGAAAYCHRGCGGRCVVAVPRDAGGGGGRDRGSGDGGGPAGGHSRRAVRRLRRDHRGRAVQADPLKSTLKARGTVRLKLKYDEELLKCAFKFNLRRYTVEPRDVFGNLATFENFGAIEAGFVVIAEYTGPPGRGLHSSTFQLNLSRV